MPHYVTWSLILLLVHDTVTLLLQEILSNGSSIYLETIGCKYSILEQCFKKNKGINTTGTGKTELPSGRYLFGAGMRAGSPIHVSSPNLPNLNHGKTRRQGVYRHAPQVSAGGRRKFVAVWKG